MGDILGILGSLGARPAATARPEARKGRSQASDDDSWSENRGHKARKDGDDDKD